MLSVQAAAALLSLLLLCGHATASEHPMLKQASVQFDTALKQADASVAAQVQAARDGYLAVLRAARPREVSAKRPAGVAGIDAEIAAVTAGLAEGAPAEHLPADLRTYRTRFVTDTKRALVSNDSVRKHATDQYLKWLEGMEAASKRVRDEPLVAAILAERKRVATLQPKHEAGGAKP